ncbi:helix-turn-helix transcriptional regulator [Pseudoduganella namucuonensis]|uniref:DNA-binding transcriptional regulator, CsgD family n=1 Tax=Pseudoduganella namucuonensis TaxID=1035707 RepID=A0A1I7L7J8_9BURK|nr:hypothetical protein [Pseudoduganella namucuonensis]SFV05615.1 DNA-binding transcriptional regulator, CsgD family [Pseudoduganella namucuonensis]
MNTADTLLFKLYGCEDDPAQWSGVLNQLCRETGARSAVLQAVKLRGGRLAIAWTAADAQTLGRDAAPLPGVDDEDNPRLEVGRIARGLDRVIRDEDLFDRGDPARGRLQERLAQRRLGRFMGSLQQLDGDTYLGLALHRDIDDPDDFSAAQAGHLAMLAPHFKQAIGVRARLRAGADLEHRLRRHLDHLRGGLLVCDGDGRVRWMNRSARELLAGGDSLRLRDGGLRAAGAANDAALRRELAVLAGGDADLPREPAAAASVGGGTRYLTLGQGPQCLHLALQALAPRQAGGQASVFVAVTGAAAGAPVSPAAIAALFGLTPAEARLVAALVGGSTLEQYALARGVGLGTVRGQLKQAQAKTGASRQAELVRLVLSSAAAQLLDAAAPDLNP